jgi:hypothetical protein
MMKHPILLLIMALLVLLGIFTFEISNVPAQEDVQIIHQVVRDGTWVDSVKPYKLPEKKHFWAIP